MTQAQIDATRKAARQGGEWHLPDCKRCGHTPDAHRLDDSTNVSPTDPEAKFRCVGYQSSTGQWIDTFCDCPDYVGKMTKGSKPEPKHV